MSLVGRKPVPREIRDMTGNVSSHKLPNPMPRKNKRPLGGPPRWMTELQKEIWRESRALAPTNVLRELDASVFQTWVVAQANMRRASQQFEDEGSVMVVMSANGNTKANPLLGIIRSENMVILKCAAEMGFSPVSKMRVKDSGDNDDEPANPFNEFTSNGQAGKPN